MWGRSYHGMLQAIGRTMWYMSLRGLYTCVEVPAKRPLSTSQVWKRSYIGSWWLKELGCLLRHLLPQKLVEVNQAQNRYRQLFPRWLQELATSCMSNASKFAINLFYVWLLRTCVAALAFTCRSILEFCLILYTLGICVHLCFGSECNSAFCVDGCYGMAWPRLFGCTILWKCNDHTASCCRWRIDYAWTWMRMAQ